MKEEKAGMTLNQQHKKIQEMCPGMCLLRCQQLNILTDLVLSQNCALFHHLTNNPFHQIYYYTKSGNKITVAILILKYLNDAVKFTW